MGNQPFWQRSTRDHRSARRIERMTAALLWLRRVERSYIIFGDTARPDRYVQFANDLDGSPFDAVATGVASPLPALVAAAVGGPGDQPGFIATTVPNTGAWVESGRYYGEPDHEALLMEVGSGDWPRSSRRGLADDETVVANLAALGLRLGGGRHVCRNFCRDNVTEPSDILATLSEESMVEIVHAQPGYRLTLTRGHFR